MSEKQRRHGNKVKSQKRNTNDMEEFQATSPQLDTDVQLDSSFADEKLEHLSPLSLESFVGSNDMHEDGSSKDARASRSVSSNGQILTRCILHDEPLKYFDITDECIVCRDCIDFGDSKGHEVDLLRNALLPRRQEMSDLAEKLVEGLNSLRDLGRRVKETSEDASRMIRRAQASYISSDHEFGGEVRVIRRELQEMIHMVDGVAPKSSGGSSAVSELEKLVEDLEQQLQMTKAQAHEERRLREVAEQHWQAQAAEERHRREQLERAAAEAEKFRKTDFPAVQVYGAWGPKAASMNGIFDAVDEVCCGMQVYQKRTEADVWIEYNDQAKSWQVKRTASKGQDLCWAMVQNDPGTNPELATAIWRVYDGTTWQERPTFKLVVAQPSVHVRGISGPRAPEALGIFDPTDELSGGAPVYQKQKDSDMCMEYNLTAKAWQIKKVSNKGKDLCLAYIRCDTGVTPDAIGAGTSSSWRVYDGSSKLDQPTVKVLPASSGGKDPSSSSTSVTAIFDSSSGEGCWRLYDGSVFHDQPAAKMFVVSPNIEVRGVTGPKSSDMMGIYVPTDEVCAGLPIYQKSGGVDCWMEWNLQAKSWQVKKAAFKGKNKCFAYLPNEAMDSPEAADGVWRVYDGSAWRDQPSVFISKTKAK